MQITVTMTGERRFKLPLRYKELLQGLIYRMLDKPWAQWLHDNGYSYEKRSFKLFCFSGIQERYRFLDREQAFLFPPTASFCITSPIHEILQQVARNVSTTEKGQLGTNSFTVSSITVEPPPAVRSRKIRVHAVEPVEVHSTLQKADGTPKRYYYSPREKEFSDLVNRNMQKKWYALHREQCPHTLTVRPVRMKHLKERVQTFKSTMIKGWTGHFYLEGDPDILQFALDTGIGSSNSMGYGFVEVVGEKN